MQRSFGLDDPLLEALFGAESSASHQSTRASRGASLASCSGGHAWVSNTLAVHLGYSILWFWIIPSALSNKGDGGRLLETVIL